MRVIRGAQNTSLGGTENGRRPFQLVLWAVSLGWLTLLALELARNAGRLRSDAFALVPWIVLLTVANLLPVHGWQSTNLTVDLPIAIAAALVLTPAETGLIAFLGASDTKEFRGQISFSKALFNRSQVGLADFLGSFVVHASVGSPAHSSLILPLGLLVLGTITVTNYVLVGVVLSLERGYSFTRVISRLRVGTVEDFVLTFLAWAVFGAMIAALYDQIPPFALLAFLAPTLLGRQALMRSEMYLVTRKAYKSREETVTQLTHQILEERSDERRLIAADLHDEVLQPLFKVSLMAHVLKADLASGRLLAMDEDLPELLSATEVASSTLRNLIGDLRESAIGRGGLSPALSGLVRGFSRQTKIQIHADLAFVEADAAKQLVLYQVAKEALSNAIEHSAGANLWLELRLDPPHLVLRVLDDGVGFDPYVEKGGHYGLHIMRERCEAVGGKLFIDSSPGHGCAVTCLLTHP